MAKNSNIMYNALNTDFKLRVSTGALQGYSVIDKFGVNPLITSTSDPEDIWEEGGIYNYTDDAGALYYVSSTDVNDTQLTEFSVLTVDSNDNWNNEVFTQNISGQTKTQLTPPSGNHIVRIYRVSNISTRGDDYAGKIYIYEDDTVVAGVPSTAGTAGSKVRAVVLNNNNQTQMALYTIPTGKVGYLWRGEFGLEFSGAVGTGTQFAKLQYLSARNGKVFTVKKEITCVNQASSEYQDARSFPDPIPAKTDLKLYVREVSGDMGVWGTFDILLIDEELLSDDYLSAIGQIKRV